MPFFPPSQLELVFPSAPAAQAPSSVSLEMHGRRLEALLGVMLGREVSVAFNDNRSTMISYKEIGDRLLVRLHRMFHRADGEVVCALADFLARRDRGLGAILDGFIERHRDEVAAKPRGHRRSGVEPEGSHHDLTEILARVGRRYFGGRGEVDIGWGRAPSSPRRRRRTRGGTRSRALATYSFDDKTIRVSRVLDSPRVPEYVLEWVVYHEMLHHVLPVEERDGKRRYHTRSFKALERAFDDYERAVAWEEKNLDWLLR